MKKMIMKLTTAVMMLTILILSGCSDETNLNYPDTNGRVIGTIHGVVTDGNNNARMDSVMVTMVNEDEMFVTYTDELGYYIATDLYSGNYEVTFSQDGYALSRGYVYIPTLEEIRNLKESDYDHSEILNMDIYTLNAGISGKIYKDIDNGNVVAAEGVTVIADFADWDISPDEYTAVTNASGMYSFNNIPATANVIVRTLPYTDGTYSFDPTVNEIALHPNVTMNAPELGLSITDDEPFVLTHNLNEDFIVGDNIVITFNKAIDPATFDIGLSINKSAKTEINSIVWSNGNMTVTIDPDEDLVLDTWYYIWFDGKSVDGNDFEDNYDFRTQDGIEIQKTNFQPYDEYNEIEMGQAMIIDYSVAVDTSNSGNYFRVDGVNVVPSWTNGNKTLSINIPAGYVSGDNFTLSVRVYSTLADYDRVTDSYDIDIK